MRLIEAKPSPATPATLLADAAALVDEHWPTYVQAVSRRVDQLLAAADRLAEGGPLIR